LTLFSSALFELLDQQILGMIERTEDRYWRCTECGKTSIGKTDVSRHVEATHIIDHPGFTCSLCGKMVKTRDSMRKHMEKEHRQWATGTSTGQWH